MTYKRHRAGVACKWRHDYRRRTETEQDPSSHNVRINTVCSHDTRRCYVIKKPAALIKHDDEDCAFPGGSIRKSVKNVGQKCVPVADICMGMVIVTSAV